MLIFPPVGYCVFCLAVFFFQLCLFFFILASDLSKISLHLLLLLLLLFCPSPSLYFCPFIIVFSFFVRFESHLSLVLLFVSFHSFVYSGCCVQFCLSIVYNIIHIKYDISWTVQTSQLGHLMCLGMCEASQT